MKKKKEIIKTVNFFENESKKKDNKENLNKKNITENSLHQKET